MADKRPGPASPDALTEASEEAEKLPEALRSKDGEIIINYLKKRCYGYEGASCFVPDSPHMTAYNEGKRAVYNLLFRIKSRNNRT